MSRRKALRRWLLWRRWTAAAYRNRYPIPLTRATHKALHAAVLPAERFYRVPDRRRL